jgi:hypothetical protein
VSPHRRFRARAGLGLAAALALACTEPPARDPADAEATSGSSAATPSTGSASTSVTSNASTDDSGSSTADASSSSSESASEAGSGSGGVDLGPAFVEVSALVGIDHDAGPLAAPPDCLVDAIDPPLPGYFCGPERYAGGAAVADFDGDGDIDVYVTRPYGRDLLYENQGDGAFIDVATDVGLDVAVHTSGAVWGDIDNDGDQDLYVTAIGDTRNYLFVQEGGAFVEEGEVRGAAVATAYPHTSSSAAFADYDLDGDLDLYVGEWRTHAVGTHPSHARLLRNLGSGLFEDVTDAAGVNVDAVWVEAETSLGGTYVLSAGWADLDGDGFPELLLASDFRTSRLYWNDGDGSFTDGTVAAGVGTDDNGMGSAVGDFDGDGDLDWFVTSTARDELTGNRLYRYDGARTFGDATDIAGVRDGGWGWGAAFLDHDNDADLDLVMTNGWYGSAYLEDALAAWTNDGTGQMVEEAGALGLLDTGQGRGLVAFDADDDGDLEILVINNAGMPRLFRNQTADAGNWLRIRAPGTVSNRDGIGAKVIVRTEDAMQMQEIGGPSHYLGNAPREAHFGLGDAVVADVEVHWPASGRTVLFDDVMANQILELAEPPP